MSTNKIVITGGPSSGKTSIIKYLENQGKACLHEISRSIILEARKDGVDQLFLKDPDLFSKKLLEGRIGQFFEADTQMETNVFIDRGIPDIIAYMSYANQRCSTIFSEASYKYRYDQIFILPPWENIHTVDNERYESFEEAVEIHKHLLATYHQYKYNCIQVPFGSIKDRSNFILDKAVS